MSDSEGSVFVDGVDGGNGEESQEDNSQSQNQGQTTENNSGEGSEDSNAYKSSTLQNKDQGQEGDKKPDLTEKGTKLDSDPLSRVNQELANTRSKVDKYEKLLNDPAFLTKYLATFENGQVKKEDKGVEEQEIKIEDVQTTDDLQKFLKQNERKVQGKIKELDDTIKQVSTSQRDTDVANSIQGDIKSVRESYSELDPKLDKDGKPTNPDYNPALDNAIGALYERMDFDPQVKKFRGKVSLKEVADIVMSAAGAAKKQGSDQAQTEIRDKRTGKATSGGSSGAPDESSMTPAQTIAARMKRAYGH